MEDYFFLPHGVKDYIHVKYNAAPHYDGGDFNSYPARRGWTEEDLQGHNRFGNRSDEEVGDFFQTWLFFGLPIKIFERAGIDVSTSHFTYSNGIDTMATLRGLKKALRQWHEERRTWNPKSKIWETKTDHDGSEYWEPFKDIFERVAPILLRFNTYQRVSEAARQPPRMTWPLKPEVSTSILAMAEILRYATKKMSGDKVNGSTEQNWGTSQLLREWLGQKWCKFAVWDIMETWKVDSQYYLAAAPSPTGDYLALHADCTEEHCLAKVDETNYKTRHAPDYHWDGDDQVRYGGHMDNDKEWSREKPETFSDGIKQIIRAGGTPLVYYDNGAVKTMGWTEGSDTPYIAISHVWLDGLGNPDQTSLPECQLRKIQSLVDKVPYEGRNLSSSVGFWMDTLCVPVDDDELRKQCIAKMRCTYSNSSATLVLDRWINGASSTMFILQTAMRITLSNWTRRLWTFQEGLLPKEVFFHLEDNFVDIGTINSDLHMLTAQWEPRGIYLPSAEDVLLYRNAEITLLPSVFLRKPGAELKESLPGAFVPLALAMSQRNTTRLKDETICLATILGIPTEPLLSIDDKNDSNSKKDYLAPVLPVLKGPQRPNIDDKKSRYLKKEIVDLRMKRFLEEFHEMPSVLIFEDRERVRKCGFRWAPRSLLNSRFTVFETLDQKFSTITSRGEMTGLRVRYSGYCFHFGETLAAELARWHQPQPRLAEGEGRLVGAPDSWRRKPWRRDNFKLALCDDEETIVSVRLHRENVDFSAEEPYVLIAQKDLATANTETDIYAMIGKASPNESTAVGFECVAFVTKLEDAVIDDETLTVEDGGDDWLVM